MKVDSGQLSLDALEEMKLIFQHHQGENEVHVVVVNGERERKLKLGPDYKVRQSAGLRSELEEMLRGDTAQAA
ncbi:MAG: hypothetical protein IPK93_11205 [Solirubrobacterales bacterium]|nr:hypothetical protein [Solirubrobacterales bacterium]